MVSYVVDVYVDIKLAFATCWCFIKSTFQSNFQVMGTFLLPIFNDVSHGLAWQVHQELCW
jgi:hypothetical protein